MTIASARNGRDPAIDVHVFLHQNVGRSVIYRSGHYKESQLPAVVLAQRGPIVDLSVFTYGGMVTQEGCTLIKEPTGFEERTDENVCWLR